MLSNALCQALANDLRSFFGHKDRSVAATAEVWVPTLDRAAQQAEVRPNDAQRARSDGCSDGIREDSVG
jgi:hypothetical protein